MYKGMEKAKAAKNEKLYPITDSVFY